MFCLCQATSVEYVFYDAYEVPIQSDPPWEPRGAIQSVEVVPDSARPANRLVHLVAGADSRLRFMLVWNADNQVRSTVVIRAKLVEGTSFAAFNDGTKWQALEFIPAEA